MPPVVFGEGPREAILQIEDKKLHADKKPFQHLLRDLKEFRGQSCQRVAVPT